MAFYPGMSVLYLVAVKAMHAALPSALRVKLAVDIDFLDTSNVR
jgi:hypothetical protein